MVPIRDELEHVELSLLCLPMLSVMLPDERVGTNKGFMMVVGVVLSLPFTEPLLPVSGVGLIIVDSSFQLDCNRSVSKMN